ncbi:MAG: hypothetical protein JO156_07065 [Solirubrobacterales bacterium]|nr:hypothetical protein [Solirubrobacterales bacterium]
MDAEEALGVILEPSARGEGVRHGWLGDSRMGKSYAARELVDAAVAGGAATLALILDDKAPAPQYAGTVRANVDDLRARPPAEGEDPTRIVFKGHTLRTGQVVTTEEIAKLALELAMLPHPPRVLVHIDELRRATSPSGREWRDGSTPRLFSEGGGIGVSATWTTQTPQRIPAEAFDQSETLGLFRLDGRAVRYLDDLLFLDRRLVATLPTLQLGEWALYRKGEPWDGRVYRF